MPFGISRISLIKILGVVITLLLIVDVYFVAKLNSTPKQIHQEDPIGQLPITSEIEEEKIEEPELEAVEWDQLESEIKSILAADINSYGVVVRDLETGEFIGINETQFYNPASIYKLALAVMVLYDVDNGKTTLDANYLVTEKEKVYDSDYLAQIEGDYLMSLEKLLEHMIKNSDNTAMTTLEHRLGGVYKLQERMSSELGIGDITRLPLKAKAIAISDLLDGIYNQELLSPESNEFLLNLLQNTAGRYDNRIVAGVPEGIIVAHKIGDLAKVSADAGIVYGEKRDYIVVVINSGINPVEGVNNIQKISKVSYEYLNSK